MTAGVTGQPYDNGEIMMMHSQAATRPTKQQPIPQHVLDRLEDEWKKVRDSAAPQPRQQAAE